MNNIRLIAVVGGSGSGKTWLAAELAEWLGDEAAHLCLDHFYKDLSHLPEPERERVNFDDPEAMGVGERPQALGRLAEGVEVDQGPLTAALGGAAGLRFWGGR